MVNSFKITEQPHFFLNTITVDVTGCVAPYTYEWFRSGSSLSIGGHLGGSLIQKGYAYYYKVTDSVGNTLTSDAVRYDGNSVLTKVDYSNIKNVSVNTPTLSNGKISVEALGGIAPYTYEWHRLGREGGIRHNKLRRR